MYFKSTCMGIYNVIAESLNYITIYFHGIVHGVVVVASSYVVWMYLSYIYGHKIWMYIV